MREALEWLILVWSRDASAAQLQALERWRAASPSHERAWRYVQQLDGSLETIPESVAARSLRAAGRTVSRRKFVLALGLVAAGGAASYGLRGTPLVRARLADLRTATGEIRSEILPDGTRLTLNTASAVDVRFTLEARRLDLVTGEVLVATAPDPAARGRSAPRPFIVETTEGRVRPIGTRFTVRHTGSRVEVSVLEGAVRIEPKAPGAQSARLDAGRRAALTADGVQPLPPNPHAGAWAGGLLVAEQMRLGDFLDELGRYHTGIIRCHADAADLRVSGTFPATDTERTLHALEEALPIRVSRLTRYWVTVDVR